MNISRCQAGARDRVMGSALTSVVPLCELCVCELCVCLSSVCVCDFCVCV